MTTLAEQSPNTFNRVMHDHSINFQSSPLDFTIGDKCIFPAWKECRLIAKRHPGAHDCFPFKVGRDEGERAKCNFIDCSLTAPTCSAFQLKLVDTVPGPATDDQRRRQITQLWSAYTAKQTSVTA
jgi:hypothetical protein